MAEKDAVPTTQTPQVGEVTEQPAQNLQPGQNQIQVNIDYLKTTRVHICMPCYGGMLTESTFMSISNGPTLAVNWALTGPWKQ